MLHLARRGKIEEWQLQEAAHSYIWMYEKDGLAYVPFKDLMLNRVRYVKFEWLAEQWVFVDLVDK